MGNQEPVARVLQTVGQYHTGGFVAEVETVRRLPGGTNLFTNPTPRPWKGLTEEEIDSVMPYCHNEFDLAEFKDFAIAVEAKLKEINT
jgi:hypothetical protein